MEQHAVVSAAEWEIARKELLAREKELVRASDALAEARRALPWRRVDRRYVFDGPRGEATLADLFDGRSQLVVYHFMFGPDWSEGCKSCSFWADNFERNVVHLAHRDFTFVAISRAPLEKLEAFRRRLGWTFPWYSSGRTDFNRDFCVSFDPGDRDPTYNYRPKKSDATELPGISVFARGDGDAVFHTYSTFGRGVEVANAAYRVLDLVPKGRDEGGLPSPMAWLRIRDRYDADR